MCDNITSVTFGNQVERIPAYLCYLMFHITSVTIPESVTSIGSSAFANCFGLKSVTSLARKPPYCDSAVFSNYSATLYVPKGCKEAYRTAQEWCNFFNIEEISDNPNDPDNPDDPDDPDTPTANENAGADNFRVYVQDRTIYLSEDRGTVQVYNMAGQRIYNGHATAIPVQQSGVYVLVTNGQRLKVSVR